MTTYISTVTYVVTVDGTEEERTLVLVFQGGVTDYYWNADTAKTFYASRIEREGGKITAYGVQGPSTEAYDALVKAGVLS